MRNGPQQYLWTHWIHEPTVYGDSSVFWGTFYVRNFLTRKSWHEKETSLQKGHGSSRRAWSLQKIKVSLNQAGAGLEHLNINNIPGNNKKRQELKNHENNFALIIIRRNNKGAPLENRTKGWDKLRRRVPRTHGAIDMPITMYTHPIGHDGRHSHSNRWRGRIHGA